MIYYQEGGSEKHLRDSAGILRIQEKEIDYTYISDWAAKLGLTEIWQSIQERVTKD